mmetsp:Transcript_13208/g.47422  ORF Transcript_13208/g.47422 Transcript_13208/m.47422 type:complete len:214 (-) Transcript_13208:126-767(-)
MGEAGAGHDDSVRRSGPDAPRRGARARAQTRGREAAPRRRRARWVFRHRSRRREERGEPRDAVAFRLDVRRGVHVHRRAEVREVVRGHGQGVDVSARVRVRGLGSVRVSAAARVQLGRRRDGHGRDAARGVRAPRPRDIRARERGQRPAVERLASVRASRRAPGGGGPDSVVQRRRVRERRHVRPRGETAKSRGRGRAVATGRQSPGWARRGG